MGRGRSLPWRSSNALGDVLDGDGRIVAGARGPDGSFLDSARLLRQSPPTTHWGGGEPRPARNTTLCVVATDAPLDRRDLSRLARMSTTALSRRVSPVNTPFDGDIVFTLSTAPTAQDVDPAALLAQGNAARDAVEEAITGAVEPAGG